MTKEMRLCIIGELRSGKSTVADYLEEKYHTTPFAFGDELKKGFHYEYPHVQAKPKPRKGYQLYGQLKRYVFGEDYWVNITFDEIHRIRLMAKALNITGSESPFSPMITDARQPNEFERCRLEGYTLIKVWAPIELRAQRSREEGDNFEMSDFYHETEGHVEAIQGDFTIINTGSLAELYEQVDIIIAALGGENNGC